GERRRVLDRPTPEIPFIVRDLLGRAPQGGADERRAAADLAIAFGFAVPDLDRLAWHGQRLRLVAAMRQLNPVERGRALERYLIAAPLSAHQRLALQEAAWQTGLGRVPLPSRTPA